MQFSCVLFVSYREQLIKWFVDLQLSDYKVAFHESEEVGYKLSW